LAEGQPPDAKSIVVLSKVSIEIDNEQAVSMVISGKTYNYRERFRALGVQSGRAPRSAAAAKGQYVQFIKSIDVATEGQRVLDVFGDKCLKNMAVKVVVDGACGQEDDSMQLISKLRDLPNLFF